MRKGALIGHSKLKNCGILFEALVRQITSDILSGVDNSPALKLMKKYFNTGRELGRELQLYQACVNTNQLSETRALQFLNMIVDQRRKLDENKLNVDKYEFIKELRQHYNADELLGCKLTTYKLYASIYKTFLAETRHKNDNILNIQDVASARFTLLEHLLGQNKSKQTTQESALYEDFKNQTEDLRLLSYKILVDKFNEKYSVLNDKQQTLLREYINDVTGQTKLLAHIKKEIPVLQKELRTKSAKLMNKVTQIKINEVITQLNLIGEHRTIKDDEITQLMIAYEISKELDNESKSS